MSEPRRGVNLGGWLVLEKWLTPSIFTGTKAVDEYTYCQQVDVKLRRRLIKHRDNFITEPDFAWLAEQAVQLVRLPVGYWLFGDAEPYLATVQYVDKAYAWAAKYNVEILLDLHGAPGSQNGNDHSGQRGDIGWPKNPTNMTATLDIIDRLCKRYSAHKAWLGLAILNEPERTISKRLRRTFYKQAYAIVTRHNANSWVVASDSFQPWRWYLELPKWRYPNLRLDYHHYQLFQPSDKLRSPAAHLREARQLVRRKVWRMSRFHRIVIGEWSLAFPPETLQKFSKAERLQIAKDYAAAQLQAFTCTDAWFFWTYKTEQSDMWSFRYCLQHNLFFEK